MGIPMSMLGKLGLPSIGSASYDHFFHLYFNNVKTFSDFHKSCVSLISGVNSILPGEHYALPEGNEIEELYTAWNNAQTDEQQKKDLIKTFMETKVTKSGSDNSLIMTGLVVPPSAMFLKKTADNIPQVKKFRLNLIPNVVFVPACTLAVITGVRLLQIKTHHKSSP